MALDFPNSPTIGDEFTGGGFTWVWTGDSWDKVMASVASGGNGFSLLVGATGNTTYAFATPQPAGAYSLTSQLGDTTFDIYLVTAANANAGYTNTTALEATAEFDRIVVYGATTNDILNFEYKPSAAPATSGDVADGAAPFLISATPSTLASVDDTTTVTGGNFASDVEIVFTGQDAVDRPAKSIVRSSSTSLIVTRPDTFPIEQEPYSMTATNAGITNPSTNVNKLTDYFDAGGGITWVTTSPLPGATKDGAYSTTLEATDADGTSVVYSLTAGSLPTGLSLNGSTGVISGTATIEESQTFTITATDAGGNSSAREFTLAVIVPTLEYLVIAGGAGGGGSRGGGGGAGGYRSSVVGESSGGGASAEALFSFIPGTNYTVTVGSGGAGGAQGVTGGNGTNSVFGTITTVGGGGGAGAGQSGASGGSGGGDDDGTNKGSGTANQGFAGGNAGTINFAGGGGGGAGGLGGNGGAVSSTTGGTGGIGLVSSVTGSNVGRAGGGGGGVNDPSHVPGIASHGGGASGYAQPAPGAPNTGGGGGAGSNDGVGRPGAAGGSGVVILRYAVNLNIIVGAGLSSYTLTDGTKKVTVFTAGSDDISFEFAAAEVTPVEFLVVAGGGSGGTSYMTAAFAGGGAGGYLSSVSSENSGGLTSRMLDFAATNSANYTVTIGAGGSAQGVTSVGTIGGNSSIAGLTAFGGGGGGFLRPQGKGTRGGSGGGGYLSGNFGQEIPGQGFRGGFGGDGSGSSGGGGGGAGAVGVNSSGSAKGHGGAGIASSITGTSIHRAGGGGGGRYLSETGGPGDGGIGGGGAGGNYGNGFSGAANTGGGGGGSARDYNGGNGGSGVVILRYPSTKTLTVGAGLTSSTTTVGANKVTVLTAGTDTISLS
jgi:hypothetical protein